MVKNMRQMNLRSVGSYEHIETWQRIKLNCINFGILIRLLCTQYDGATTMHKTLIRVDFCAIFIIMIGFN